MSLKYEPASEPLHILVNLLITQVPPMTIVLVDVDGVVQSHLVPLPTP